MDQAAAEVAAGLRALAKLPEFSARERDLKSLSDELASDTDDTWVGIDLIAAFPPGAALDSPSWHRAERWLSYVATVAIFLPIAWTWVSFRAAAAVYRDMLESGPISTDTFLSLWATGFRGRLDWYHHLVFVALGSIAIILAAALLVVVQRWMVYRNQKAENATYARLTAALVGAQRILNKRATAEPTSVAAFLRRSVRDVIDAHTHTEAAAAALRTATSEMQAALTPVLTSLTEVGKDLTVALASSDATTRELSKTVARTQTEVDKILVDFTQRLTEALNQFRGDATTLIRDGEASQSALIEKAERASVEVSSAVQQLGADHRQLTAAIRGLPVESQTAAEPLTTAVREFMNALNGWTATLSQHSEELRGYASATQGQVSEITNAKDDTHHLLNSLLDRLPVSGNGHTSGDQHERT